MTAGVVVFTIDDLERALCAADPAALLLPPRILRRVIKKQCGLSGPGLQAPHRKSCVISREALLTVADRSDLGLKTDRALPEMLLLFPSPDARKLRRLPPEATLLKYWRLLFHARVHQEVARRLPAGAAGEAVVRERVRRIGQAEAEEVRTVLRQENYLLHPHNLRSIYEEFAAVFLELHCFAPHRLPYFFPAIRDLDGVFRILDADVDAAGLFNATRLKGAPDPVPASRLAEEGEAPAEPPRPPPASHYSPASRSRLARIGATALERGNDVRAAILLERAARAAGEPDLEKADRTASTEAVDRLTVRLLLALGFPPEDGPSWRRGLRLLVGLAANGPWTRAGRLLYDLQRICIDYETDVSAVDLVEWLLSWGRRPLIRLLPHQSSVNLVRRLRRSIHRLASVGLPEPDRVRLLELFRAAVSCHEEQLRDRFRPLILTSLEEAGLRPRRYVERVARDKIIEELLDRIVERGFLTLGDLRDALARNRLKLADLSGPGEFLGGDPLLRADRMLAVSLDGVYRRGEIYLRGLQRVSALAFGTAVGRFLTLYLILPLLGAFVVLKGAQELVELVGRRFLHPAAVKTAGEGTQPLELLNLYSFATTAVFLLLILHVPWFRRKVFAVFRLLWLIVRGVFYDLPAGFLRLSLVRAFFGSRAYLRFYLLVLKPLALSAPPALILYWFGADPSVVLIAWAGLLLAVVVLLHSRLGMQIEEAFGGAALRGWRLFSRNLIPGLFALILAFFRRLLDDVERLLYTVDEWLRFRSGDRRGSLALKAVLGFFWFFVTYIVRFCLNLLIEPQINPIKHFPVVTVSHKLIFAFLVTPLTPILLASMNPLTAGLLLFVIQFGLPGVPGFLVWEFKENWRLYRANQPRDLRPQIAGSHGETIPRLLRPGFHSGTLPKLYARLRRIKGTGLGKRREQLHHVEEAVRRFVERNLLAQLAGSKTWGVEAPPQVGSIRLASNRIRIELRQPGQGEANIHIDLEEHAGRLVAGIAAFAEPKRPDSNGAIRLSHGWLDRLPLEQVRAFTDALAGFYKAAGVDLVREQVETLLPAGAWFTFDDRGLIVETGSHFERGAVYALQGAGELAPSPLSGTTVGLERNLSADRLIFQRMPIRWEDWAEVWERDLAGKGHKPPLIRGVQLLPLGTAKGRWAARRK
jgi:hypothetical protein